MQLVWGVRNELAGANERLQKAMHAQGIALHPRPREVFQFSVMLLRLFGPLLQRDHGWRSVGRHRGPPIASAVTARRANVVFRRLGG